MRPAFDLSLYLVTDPEQCAARGLVETVRAAAAGGVTLVQLRDKTTPEPALRAEAAALLAVLRPLGVPLLINDRIEVAAAVGADGAHIGQDDGDPAAARRALGSRAILGLSAQTEAHLAAVDPGIVDYLGIGAVYASTTKPPKRPPLGVAAAGALRVKTRLPAVAIGGIGAGQARPLIQAGFDGVATVSAICAAADPAAAARALADEIAAARAERATISALPGAPS